MNRKNGNFGDKKIKKVLFKKQKSNQDSNQDDTDVNKINQVTKITL